MPLRSPCLLLAAACLLGCGSSADSIRAERTASPPPPAPAPEGDPDDHLIADLSQISCGRSHTCAVGADGDAYCWGANLVGQLGNGTRTNRDAPVRVPVDASLRAISAGARSTCAIDREGAVWCWGANEARQLGNDETTGRPAAERVEGLTEIRRLASGWASPRHCGVDADGVAHCWGRLGAQLDSDLVEEEPDATLVGVGGPVVDVSVGRAHECALLAAGDVLCRGIEVAGQTRDTTARFAQVPDLADARGLAAGGQHVCAATAEGLRCWGDNRAGQLGDGTRDDADAPVAVPLDAPVDEVVAGASHTCARTRDGRVLCWGDDEVGQLGLGGDAPVERPAVVELDAPARDLCAGLRHTCALTENGHAYCWGENRGGQLGDGTWEPRPNPVAVLHPRSAVPATPQDDVRHVPEHGPITEGPMPEH